MSGSDKVHLMDLRLRTSAAGNQYLSGWLGKAAVVGFRDREADGEVWNIFVSTPAPRQSGGQAERPADQSPFMPRQRKPRGSSRPMQPGELDDRLDDL
jgi:hypothetical protein